MVEADGGSRGNPGPAGYGALVRDAVTGRVLAERAASVGRATNNVAEYGGLVAGLQAALDLDPTADVEVRMDSKLVVEQMSGRWKIKHPAMRPLAMQANQLAPQGTRYTWIPREQNKHADRLANLALDGPEGVVHGGPAESTCATDDRAPTGSEGDTTSSVVATGTLVLVHHAAAERVAATAEWLADGLSGTGSVVVSAPQRTAVSSAELIGRRLGTGHVVEEGLDQALAEDRSGRRAAAVRDRLLTACAGRVGVVVTGPTQIRTLTALALGLPPATPLSADLAPGSVTVLGWSADGPVVRLLGGLPHLALSDATAG